MLNKFTTSLLIAGCLILSVSVTKTTRAQSEFDTINVGIVQDTIIDSLLVLHKKYNALNPKMDGFRIQIYFESGNNSKIQATEFKDEFIEKFPDIRAYITFKEPYYRVRIGDYRSRIEADGILKSIIREYPNAFVIKDRINFPQLYEEPIIDSLEILSGNE